MSALNFDELKTHVGHEVNVVTYGSTNVAIECEDCSEILVDFDAE